MPTDCWLALHGARGSVAGRSTRSLGVIRMNRPAIKSVVQVLAIIVYAGAGIFMLVRVFWYFHQWNLPLWQWIGAVVVTPITFIVVPFYVGFTEGDWSLVGAWVGGVLFYVLSMWYASDR